MGLLFLVVTSNSTQPIFPDAYPVHAHAGPPCRRRTLGDKVGAAVHHGGE